MQQGLLPFFDAIECKERRVLVSQLSGYARIGIIPPSWGRWLLDVCGLMHFLELLADSIASDVIAKRT